MRHLHNLNIAIGAPARAAVGSRSCVDVCTFARTLCLLARPEFRERAIHLEPAAVEAAERAMRDDSVTRVRLEPLAFGVVEQGLSLRDQDARDADRRRAPSVPRDARVLDRKFVESLWIAALHEHVEAAAALGDARDELVAQVVR